MPFCKLCRSVKWDTEGDCEKQCIIGEYFVAETLEMMTIHYEYGLLKQVVEHKHATDPVGLKLWISTKLVDIEIMHDSDEPRKST